MGQKYFDDINILRCLVLLCLLVYHSTAFFIGAWQPPFPYEEGTVSSIYAWVARFSYAIMLEMFTFVSGYLFASQIKGYSLWSLVKKKFARLFIPALFWGCIYGVLLRGLFITSGWQGISDLLTGVGHLWYLPMLFWCFIFAFLLIRLLKSPLLVLGTGLLLCVLSRLLVCPFGGFLAALKYLLYFLLGYYSFIYHEWIFEHLQKRWWIVIGGGVFLLLFFGYYVFLPMVELPQEAMIRFGVSTLYKCVGVLLLYLFVNRYMNKFELYFSLFRQLSLLSMGIYIFHQMIIEFLYYHIYWSINVAVLPIIACFIAFFVSVLLTFMLRKIKLMRRLL